MSMSPRCYSPCCITSGVSHIKCVSFMATEAGAPGTVFFFDNTTRKLWLQDKKKRFFFVNVSFCPTLSHLVLETPHCCCPSTPLPGGGRSPKPSYPKLEIKSFYTLNRFVIRATLRIISLSGLFLCEVSLTLTLTRIRTLNGQNWPEPRQRCSRTEPDKNMWGPSFPKVRTTSANHFREIPRWRWRVEGCGILWGK